MPSDVLPHRPLHEDLVHPREQRRHLAPRRRGQQRDVGGGERDAYGAERGPEEHDVADVVEPHGEGTRTGVVARAGVGAWCGAWGACGGRVCGGGACVGRGARVGVGATG